MVNIRILGYLAAVAQMRHFGRAAERCHVSQPTLSRQLGKLEDYLGIRLFERGGRRVLPTPAGRPVIEKAEIILREFDEMKELARRARQPDSWLLRLGVFPTLAPYLLPQAVPLLRQHYPGLRLHLVEEKTEVLVRHLQEGELDLALLALPLAEPELQQVRLFQEPFLVAVNRSHPLAARQRIQLADIASEELLLLDEGHCFREQALSVCKKAGARENSEFRATSLETLKHMVATEAGITLVPKMAADNANTAVKYIPFTRPQPNRTIGLVWRRGTPGSEFFREIAQHISTLKTGKKIS